MKRLLVVMSLVGVALVSSGSHLSAEPAAPQATYELVKSYSGPGGSGSAGIYDLASSIGQPTAGEVSAGSYTLGSGFWGGGVLVSIQDSFSIYLPLVLK